MQAFVIMPFSQRFDDIYDVIKSACVENDVLPIREDNELTPGAIINRIFKSIGDAAFVIADVSDPNPNVYYEVGVAHALNKPTLLLAQASSLSILPFDIRHNRVLAYHETSLDDLSSGLSNQILYIKTNIVNGGTPSIESHIVNLNPNGQEHDINIQSFLEEISDSFSLTKPSIKSLEHLAGQGYLISVEDHFGAIVRVLLDNNGMIRKASMQ